MNAVPAGVARSVGARRPPCRAKSGSVGLPAPMGCLSQSAGTSWQQCRSSSNRNVQLTFRGRSVHEPKCRRGRLCPVTPRRCQAWWLDSCHWSREHAAPAAGLGESVVRSQSPELVDLHPRVCPLSSQSGRCQALRAPARSILLHAQWHQIVSGVCNDLKPLKAAVVPDLKRMLPYERFLRLPPVSRTIHQFEQVHDASSGLCQPPMVRSYTAG